MIDQPERVTRARMLSETSCRRVEGFINSQVISRLLYDRAAVRTIRLRYGAAICVRIGKQICPGDNG